MMNKSTGNMFDWIDFTFNIIRGECPHKCSYCDIKKISEKYGKKQSKMHLVEKEFTTNLGENNTIFVGSSFDMFAHQVPDGWIKEVLEHCRKYNNTYLFQSKNPKRFWEFLDLFPEKTILSTTLESNYKYRGSKAPHPEERASWMEKLPDKFTRTVTIEPVMDFDLEKFVPMIYYIHPKFVSVGADSKNCGLKEPSSEKVKELIKKLEEFTEVVQKKNLKRLLDAKL